VTVQEGLPAPPDGAAHRGGERPQRLVALPRQHRERQEPARAVGGRAVETISAVS
jgi:hypothetical protein